MSSHFHAVAWIDHREAKIIHFNDEDSSLTSVRSHHPDLHIHHKANSGDSGHAPVDAEFLERVVKALGEAGAILVTGPSNAKTELMTHVQRVHPGIAQRISGVETVDHPTDRQILAHARKFFRANDRMHSTANFA